MPSRAQLAAIAGSATSSVGRWSAVPLISFSAFIGLSHGSAKVAWIVGASILAVFQVSGTFIDNRREKAARRAAELEELTLEEQVAREHADRNLALADTYTPLLRVIAQIHETRGQERAMHEGVAVRSVVAAAASSIGPSRARACYFRLDMNGQDGAELVFVTASGRDDEPHTRFLADTPVGDQALCMLQDDTYMFCEDTETDPPSSWQEHEHEYRTFLSLPVRGDKTLHGMITVDAPAPGDLVLQRDRPVLVVLARILAASQASAPPVSTASLEAPGKNPTADSSDKGASS